MWSELIKADVADLRLEHSFYYMMICDSNFNFAFTDKDGLRALTLISGSPLWLLLTLGSKIGVVCLSIKLIV